MTADEALAVLSDLLEGRNVDGDPTEALAVLRSGLQHAQVLAVLTADPTATAIQRRIAWRRFTDWDAGRRA